MTLTDEDKSIYVYPKRQLFLLICLATLATLFVKKSMIENETAAFEFLADQPEGSFLYLRSALQYLSIPFIYAWKFTALGFVIWVGCFLFGYRVTFSQCWKIVLVAEFIFLVPEVIKIGWFFFVVRDPVFFEIRAFFPLSLMNLLDYRTLDGAYSYPAKALNLFEPVYWFLLVRGITHYTRKETKPAWIIVLGFYVPVFLLWLLFYSIVY
jgi:multidrug transporter EmrE-like cation transporter